MEEGQCVSTDDLLRNLCWVGHGIVCPGLDDPCGYELSRDVREVGKMGCLGSGQRYWVILWCFVIPEGGG